MTLDTHDILYNNLTTHTQIKLANSDFVHVDCEGSIALSLSANCLFTPNFLSYKFLSVSQITMKLDCFALITADGCLMQDIKTKKIICCLNLAVYITWKILALLSRGVRLLQKINEDILCKLSLANLKT